MFNNNNNIVIHGGTFTLNQQTVNLHSSRGIDHLKAAAAPGAFHNSRERFDPPKCHPHTREAVLKKILEWVQRKIDTHAFVVWLYGAAGAGKSAIAQTIAEICYKEGLLLASFFFARSDSFRNTTKHLVATLAYQATLAIPSARGLVETAIENDPLIFTRSLDAQFSTLILRPLEQLQETGVFAQIPLPALIILDGLDECIDNTRTHLLDVISDITQTGMLIFLIASRAEQDISTAIRFGSMEGFLSQIALDTEYQSSQDIELFFREKFYNIKRTHPLRAQIPSSWPPDTIIQSLVEKSSGQFIYAATALRYVSSPRHRPTNRLNIILGTSPPLNENDTPFAQLDALYMHIISSSEDPQWTVRFISACVLLGHSFNQMTILEDFLGLPRGDSVLVLSDLASIIEFVEVIGGFRVLHASLGDFLFDASRSRQFHVDPQQVHAEISRWHLSEVIKDEDRGMSPWSNAAHHCALARMTHGLVDDLRSTSLRDKFEESLKNSSTISISFHHCIKDMKFEGAEHVYMEYLSIYDREFASYLDKKSFTSLDLIHYRDAQLLGLNGPYSHINSVGVEQFLSRVFSRIFKVPFDCKLSFMPFLPDRKIYIYDFFGDKTRSGRHAIHDGHYTMSAEKSAEYLLEPHYIPIEGIRAWALNSRKRPWLWRTRRQLAITSIHKHWKLRLWKKYVMPYYREGGNWGFGPLEIPMDPLLVVHIVLSILPPLLANAAQGSADLDTLCEALLISGRLPYFIFPKQCKVTRRAIKGYLFWREEGRTADLDSG